MGLDIGVKFHQEVMEIVSYDIKMSTHFISFCHCIHNTYIFGVTLLIIVNYCIYCISWFVNCIL